MGKNDSIAIIALGAAAAAGFFLYGRSGKDNVSTRQNAKVQKLEAKQQARVDKTEIRNTTITTTVDRVADSFDNLVNKFGNKKRRPKSPGNFSTTFSPKKAQEVAYKLATPNKYTYTPSGRPNYALSASINRAVTQATPTKKRTSFGSKVSTFAKNVQSKVETNRAKRVVKKQQRKQKVSSFFNKFKRR